MTFPIKEQGLHAYRKLREWRKLHELSWDPASVPEVERTYLEQMEEDKTREEEAKKGPKRKGGSRTPKRKTDYQKQRRKVIMNQKANSVADLAAVLVEQEELGAASEEARQKDEAREKEVVLKSFHDAEAAWQDGALEPLREEITSLAATIESMMTPEVNADDVRRNKRKQLVEELFQMRIREHRISAVGGVVGEVGYEAEREAEQTSEATSEKVEQVLEQTRVAQFVDTNWKHPLLATFRRLYPESQRLQQARVPKRERARIERLLKNDAFDIYTMDGIGIRWANPLDLEYAEAWPEAVEHSELRFDRTSKHSAVGLERQRRMEIAEELEAEPQRKALEALEQQSAMPRPESAGVQGQQPRA